MTRFPRAIFLRRLLDERPNRLLALCCAAAVLAGVALVLTTPPKPEAPAVPDFAAIADIEQRKAAFFAYLRPLIEAENAAIARDRKRIQALHAQFTRSTLLPWSDRRWLEVTAEHYDIDIGATHTDGWFELLLRRVDKIPVDLALAQAAIESAWGRSRFAVEGNNYYGQWCYRPGCGIVPARRRAGDRHEVRAFTSVAESVASYLHNLNSHPQYRGFRVLREQLRRQRQPVTALSVLDGLEHYSERREEYLMELRAVISSQPTLNTAVGG